MRRPLSAVLFLFVLLLGTTLFFFPVEYPDLSAFQGQSINLTGKVLDKEWRRTSDGSVVLQVHLDGIAAEGEENFPEDALTGALCRFTVLEGTRSDYSARYTSLAGTDKSTEMPALPEDVRTSFEAYEDTALPVGAEVRVRGILYEISEATNHGEFDGRAYYGSQGIAFRMYECEVLAVQERRGIASYVMDALYRFRRRLCRLIEAVYRAEDASLVEAMLLGQKGFLDADTKNRYQASGIIHAICISGLHIGILSGALFSFLCRLGVSKKIALIPSFLTALLYGLLTGLSVSALRAVIMFGILCGARAVLRTYDIVTAAALSAALLLCSMPLYLKNTGFLFSFAAVLGIGLLGPALKGKLSVFTIPLATLPVYLAGAQSFPVYAVFLNLLILPLMTGLLVLELSILLLAAVSVPAASAACLPVHVILRFFDALCGASGGLPGHTQAIGHRPLLQIGIYLVLLLLMVPAKDLLPDVLKCLWMASCVLFLTLSFSFGLSIHVIDVGQGDGILITYNGTTILLDGGSTSKSDVGTYQLLPVLRYYGIDRIDCIVLSHEDMDHMNGTYSLIENACTHEGLAGLELSGETDSGISIGCVLLPGVAVSDTGENTEKLVAMAKEKGIPVGYMARDDTIRWKDLTLTCLHPEAGRAYGDANNGSVVLLLNYGKFTALFTGDLETGDAETEFLAALEKRRDLFPEGERLTLLKCQHHGSRGGSSKELLERTKPLYAVISCGRNNRYGHPHRETVERLKEAGAKILDTRNQGEITMWTDGRNVSVSGFLDGT